MRRRRDLSRREFIRVAGTSAAGLALLGPLSTTAPAAVAEGLKDTGLRFGGASGDVTPSGTIVWLRAEGKGGVSVQYGKEPALKEFATTPPVLATKESDFTAKIMIDGLEPQTTYYYRGAMAGKKPGPIHRFVTAPKPNDTANVQFAFSGDSRERFKPFTIMDSIRAMRPDFFLHLGDTIYADVDGVASRLPQYWAKYAANRSDLPTQRLLSETSTYVTWDDHEVTNDYHPANPLAPIGRRAFFDYWPIRQDPKESHRLYRSFRWGKAAELFILDTRQYRDPISGTILGRQQKEWFLESLSSSTAWFKFIATSVPFSSPHSDKWGGFPEERDEVLKFLTAKKIGGVIFIAADVHYAAVSRVSGGSGLKEFIVGPLAAPMGRASGTAKRFEFFSNDSYNYGMVRVHAKADPPYTEIEILDQDNKLLHKSRVDSSPWGFK
ncbi:MAG: alkaline phosphatase D family protein [Candidatus Binatia bacterium]